MDLSSGIITIVVACGLFAVLKGLIDWLRKQEEGERKRQIVMLVLLFLANLATLWWLFGA